MDLGVLGVGSLTSNPLNLFSWDYIRSGMNSEYVVFHSNATGRNYTVGSGNKESSEKSLSELFTAHLGGTPTGNQTRPTYNVSDSNIISCSLGNQMIEFIDLAYHTPSEVMKSLTFYLRSADISNLTDNVANALTARIRNSDMRGKINLTIFPGNAFVNETFITVQWPWMILPIMEIVLAAVTLAVTITLTRQQALLKGSTLPLLMQHMDGWSSEETNVRRRDTMEQLRERVKKMVARLDEGQDGELLFKRHC